MSTTKAAKNRVQVFGRKVSKFCYRYEFFFAIHSGQ